ncbi:NXPE family member 3-like isoform X2 [Engraulis encrasicolus]|uniref:NXPE family member 3-like isoform X2 n=1 Tax=Engraulis encrasicolus TaxID=184585 RepID=UPI002FD70777
MHSTIRYKAWKVFRLSRWVQLPLCLLVTLPLILLLAEFLWRHRSGDGGRGAGVPLPWFFQQQQHHHQQQHLNRTQRPAEPTAEASTPEASTATSDKSTAPPPGLSGEEWQRMLRALHWGGPESQVSSVNLSTSPSHSTFTIQGLKHSYVVGEQLHATIFARDFAGQLKRYGGDFFQAKVYSDELKASVFGEVVDHQNGTYSAHFTLPWAGQASVAIRLIHSSEAVQVLKQHRSTDSNRVYFHGFFVGKDSRHEESVVCNVKWEGVVLPATRKKNCCCEYSDVRTGLTWQCLRPRKLPCDALRYHSVGGYANRLTPLEKVLMNSQHVNRWLKGDSRLITILGSNTTNEVKTPCKAGLPIPTPAGYYLNNVWTSFVCATRHFSVEDTTECLKNKHIYIVGDSTSRQWFEYFVQTVPTLTRMNLHSVYHVGPLMAVDVQNNVDLHYRSHGLPLRCAKTPVASLQYISNVIDGLVGGGHDVLLFDMWAHFTNFPLSYYAHRVALVRRAVLALLKRAPTTKVIIKTANTGYKDIYGSDWLSMQLDRILREAFRNVGVYILDVWQMTACHYNHESIHPAPVIVKNEVDILLSYMCPK